MKKILVVRYRFIGDMILTIPFLRNLRYAYPDAQIDMIVSPNSGEVIEDCPYVNNFIYLDTTRKHKYENGKGKKKSLLSYVSVLRKEKYDKVYVLKRSFSSAMLCFLAGIKERIGYNTEYRSFMLTKSVPYDKKKHESLCFLDVLKADNIQIKDTYLENWVQDENKNNINNLLKKYNILQNIPIVVINATATNEWKVWDINNYARIVEYLSNIKKMQVVFIGAPSDREIYNNIQYIEKLDIPPLNLCGEVSLKDSLALLQKAVFLIGNDSGNLHMASSIGTPVIGLYGPMPFEKWKAIGDKNILLKSNLPCIPCELKHKCNNNKQCMKDITVAQVKEAVDTLCERSAIFN